MSKIRQAVRYERQLVDAKVQAHVDLTNAQLELAAQRSADHKELLSQAIAYERRYTDGQFSQVSTLSQEHRVFHEREHILYEDAIEKAATALNSQLRVLEAEVERMRDDSHKFMTVDRFDREHSLLIDKMETAFATMAEKIGVEEKVTLRSQAQEELLTKISQSNRWMIGIMVTVGIFGLTTLLHVFKVI